MHIHHLDISIYLEDELLLKSFGDHHQEDGGVLSSYVGCVTCPGSMFNNNNNGSGDDLSMMLEHVIWR